MLFQDMSPAVSPPELERVDEVTPPAAAQPPDSAMAPSHRKPLQQWNVSNLLSVVILTIIVPSFSFLFIEDEKEILCNYVVLNFLLRYKFILCTPR